MDVVSFSGKIVKSFSIGGKKSFEISLIGLHKEKLVLVFQNNNVKVTTDIDI